MMAVAAECDHMGIRWSLNRVSRSTEETNGKLRGRAGGVPISDSVMLPPGKNLEVKPFSLENAKILMVLVKSFW